MAEENLKLEIDDAGRPLHRAAGKAERRSPWRFRDAVIFQADDGTRVAAVGPRFYATTAEGRTDWDRPLRRDQVPASILKLTERA